MQLLRYLPRFRQAARELEVLRRMESSSRGEIESLQLQRLNDLWQHAYTHVPYYLQLKRSHRLPDRFTDLKTFQSTMPSLSKEEVRKHCNEMVSSKAGPGRWATTSGSTGTPTRIRWGKQAHLESLRAKYRYYQSWGIDILDPGAHLWGHTSELKTGLQGVWARWQRRALDFLRERLRFLPYHFTSKDLHRFLEKMGRFHPRWIYAYSSLAYLLAQQALEEGWSCDSLRWACLSAEPASPEIIRVVQEAFQIPVGIEYGSIECGFLAGLSEDQTLRVREDQIILEAVALDEQRYAILATVLTNTAFPLIRYQLGDCTSAPLEYPDRGFAILPGVVGRDQDYLVTGEGQLLHGFHLDSLLESIEELSHWRVHQLASGVVRAWLVPRGKGANLDQAWLASRIRQMLKGFSVELELVSELPRNRGGKHRWIVSDRAPLLEGENCHRSSVGTRTEEN